MKKKSARGGARPGAGKKPGVMGTKIKKMLSLDRDVANYLDSLAIDPEKPENIGASAFVNGLVRKSPAFKKWSEGRNG